MKKGASGKGKVARGEDTIKLSFGGSDKETLVVNEEQFEKKDSQIVDQNKKKGKKVKDDRYWGEDEQKIQLQIEKEEKEEEEEEQDEDVDFDTLVSIATDALHRNLIELATSKWVNFLFIWNSN